MVKTMLEKEEGGPREGVVMISGLQMPSARWAGNGSRNEAKMVL